jgi:ABC-2 type transport system permease protein
MSSIALVRAHARIALLDLFRSPGYVVPTVLFPAMFFAIFDVPEARAHPDIAEFAMLAFMAWAAVGVCLYQFGVGIAQERGRPWERYVRTLPVAAAERFGARIVTALVFALLAAAAVAVLACATTKIGLTALEWARIAISLIAGGVPFVVIGITIGYWSSARAAVPIATACNLLLAYAGGLWMPPQYLPGFVQHISPYLPTRQFADLLWSAFDASLLPHAVAGLAIYTLVFAVLAVVGYRRDEMKRYA